MILIQRIDEYILNFIQFNIRTSLLDIIMPFITFLGDMAFIWIISGMILFSIKKYRKYAFMIFLSLILCSIIGNITLKPLIARPRPFMVKPLIDGLLIKAPSDYSFPSGHTMCSFAAMTVLFNFNRKIGIVALLVSVLIAISRIYLYVHYPSDVLVGIFIGIINGILSINIVNFITKKSKI